MNNYKVYMHTCPNRKKYIGITKCKVQERWNSGYGYKTQKLFFRAIKKYGWNNIKHEILYDNLTQEQACDMEKKLIKEYNLTNPKYGYNCSVGGEKTKLGSKHSKKWKEKMSKYHKSNPNSGQFKKGICPQTCFKKGNIPWNKGKKTIRKKVLCIETNIIYDGIMGAFEKTNINASHICQVCNNKRKSAGGLHWKYIN